MTATLSSDAQQVLELFQGYVDCDGDEIDNDDARWRFIDAALSLTRRVLSATQQLQPALNEFNEMRSEKQSFITEHGDDDGGEPECGWSKYGERITDYAYELADLGGGLADMITAVLGAASDGDQS